MQLLRKAPGTKALKHQIIENLDSVQRFWLHYLQNECFKTKGGEVPADGSLKKMTILNYYNDTASQYDFKNHVTFWRNTNRCFGVGGRSFFTKQPSTFRVRKLSKLREKFIQANNLEGLELF